MFSINGVQNCFIFHQLRELDAFIFEFIRREAEREFCFWVIALEVVEVVDEHEAQEQVDLIFIF